MKMNKETQELLEQNELGIEALRVDELKVDMTYQRNLSESRMGTINRAFDPKAIGIIVVSLRSNNEYYIVDGQHRVAALKARGEELVLCQIEYGLTVKQEAALWTNLNAGRQLPSSLSRFRARVAAADVEAVKIQSILESEGFTVDYGNTQRLTAVSAIAAIEKVYYGAQDTGKLKELKPKESTLRLVLKTIKAAFPSDKNGRSGNMIQGLGGFWKVYAKDISVEEVARTLRRVSAAKILADANAAVPITGTAQTAVALIIFNAVNWKKKPEHRLQPKLNSGKTTL